MPKHREVFPHVFKDVKGLIKKIPVPLNGKELQKLKNKSYNLEWSEANPADLETGIKTLAAIDADTAGNGPPKGPKSDALYKAPMVICNLNTHSSPFQR